MHALEAMSHCSTVQVRGQSLYPLSIFFPIHPPTVKEYTVNRAGGGEEEGERRGEEGIEEVESGGGEGCMRKKSMDEEQKKKRIAGWKINLDQKHCLPFPPPMHLIVNK